MKKLLAVAALFVLGDIYTNLIRAYHRDMRILGIMDNMALTTELQGETIDLVVDRQTKLRERFDALDAQEDSAYHRH